VFFFFFLLKEDHKNLNTSNVQTTMISKWRNGGRYQKVNENE